MKNTAKRLIAIVLGVMMICGILPMVASAEGDFVKDVSGKLVEYTGSGGNITIPMDITAIDDSVFNGNSKITGVTIGSNVKSIGSHAFSYCQNLKSVSIAAGIVGESAFSDCENLETVVLGKDVTAFGDSSFSWCPKLKAIEIPEGVTDIPNKCFYRCDSLASVKFPTTLKTIGSSAFWNTQVKEVHFHLGLVSVDFQAFAATENLTDVWLPDTVTSLGYHAFSHTDNFHKTVHGVPGSYVETFCEDI